MRSAFSSSPERTSENPRRRLDGSIRLSLAAAIFVLGLFSGCHRADESTRPVPETVETGLSILGPDARFVAGVNLSAFYRSFLARVHMALDDEGSDFRQFVERQHETLDELGLDPMEDDVIAIISLDELTPKNSPSLAVFAPFSRNGLESLSRKLDFFDRLDVQLPESAVNGAAEDLPIYALRDGDETLMITQPVPSLLLATTSVPDLAEMILRSRLRETEVKRESAVYALVGGEDAWFFTRALRPFLSRATVDARSPAIGNVLRAVENLGGSVRIRPESATVTLYLEPRSGVDTGDLSDLIRGALALVKLNEKTGPALTELVNQIRVSEIQGFSRVRLKVTESLIEELVASFERD